MVPVNKTGVKRGEKPNRRFRSNNFDVIGGNSEKSRAAMKAMFTIKQIPDNPEYMDFSNPSPPVSNFNQNRANFKDDKRRFKQTNYQNKQRIRNNNNSWIGRGPGFVHSQPPMPSYKGNFPNSNGMPRMDRRPFVQPLRRGIQVPPQPLMIMKNNGFRSMMPPIESFPPALQIRSSHIPPNGRLSAMQRGNHRRPLPAAQHPKIANRKNFKNRNNSRLASVADRKSISKKTLSEIVNQYPLDRPWVSDEIRNEQKKKEDIENRLKGNKDDELFAEFKIQRDKFVSMYEDARQSFQLTSKTKL